MLLRQGGDKAGTALLRWLPMLLRQGGDKAGTALLGWHALIAGITQMLPWVGAGPAMRAMEKS
jgi:hypothetical protein